jgi:catechol 2,3-dioxygenase-like lactoylglutathione lyase family enzyme
MTLRVASLVVDCHDPDRVAAFWAEVLGLEEAERNDDPDDPEIVLKDPTQRMSPILFGKTADAKTTKNRWHLDLRPREWRDDEVARVTALGATVLEGFGGPEATWMVLQDPEGNEFCILRGPEDPVPQGGRPVTADD